MIDREILLRLLDEEGTIFERSAPGRKGYPISFPEVPKRTPAEGARLSPVDLPEVGEPEVVRHYARLSRLNEAGDLGGRTRKYTPRILEEIAGLEGLKRAHPDLPAEFCQGAMEILWRLERALSAISGLDECSMQAGGARTAMGAGLTLVRAFHEHHVSHRRIVLFPEALSDIAAPAAESAAYRPEPIAVQGGTLTAETVQEAIDRHGRDIAALILTVPGPAGLFQPHITEVAELLHGIGAQLYLDGSNIGALAGIVKPRDMGIDVMHFDLGAFGVPSGSGGPSARAIGVRAHLAPYLPGPRVRYSDKGYVWETPPHSIGKIGEAFGDFPAAIRALAYIALLGSSGLKHAARAAVLNESYLKALSGENSRAWARPFTESESLYDLERLAKAKEPARHKNGPGEKA